MAFRRKHLRLMLGQLETMAAFKAAVGSTPGRVHPNVVRAMPFFVGRGPSRRIGTVVNTYAMSLRAVSGAENREIVSLSGIHASARPLLQRTDRTSTFGVTVIAAYQLLSFSSG